MSKERITLGMSMQDMLLQMGEGNPGALNVLMRLIEEAEIDGDTALPGLGSILELDSCGIYGSRIWRLFKDVASQDLRKTIGLLRAVQLGLLDRKDLDTAIDNYGRGIEVDSLMRMVGKKLPNFAKATV